MKKSIATQAPTATDGSSENNFFTRLARRNPPAATTTTSNNGSVTPRPSAAPSSVGNSLKLFVVSRGNVVRTQSGTFCISRLLISLE